MGTSSNLGALAAKLNALADAVPAAGMEGVVKAAKIMEAAVAATSGRYAGRPITRVRTTVTPVPVPSALVRMTSRKAHLLDHDTRAISRSGADTILPGAVTGVRGRKQALYIAGSDHPVASSRKGATRGQFMWERARDAALPLMAEAGGEALAGTMRKVFGL
jgi:hypothetical protein